MLEVIDKQGIAKILKDDLILNPTTDLDDMRTRQCLLLAVLNIMLRTT